MIFLFNWGIWRFQPLIFRGASFKPNFIWSSKNCQFFFKSLCWVHFWKQIIRFFGGIHGSTWIFQLRYPTIRKHSAIPTFIGPYVPTGSRSESRQCRHGWIISTIWISIRGIPFSLLNYFLGWRHVSSLWFTHILIIYIYIYMFACETTNQSIEMVWWHALVTVHMYLEHLHDHVLGPDRIMFLNTSEDSKIQKGTSISIISNEKPPKSANVCFCVCRRTEMLRTVFLGVFASALWVA